jgi:uncharacterized protein YecE (DUF72 family)
MYWSPYDQAALRSVADQVEQLVKQKRQVWVMFDNTASGAATPNALRLKDMLWAAMKPG